MNNKLKWMPIIVVVLTAGYFLSKARPHHLDHPLNLDALAATTVSADGRLQPFDSLARNTLLVFGKRTQWTPDVLMWKQVKDFSALAAAIAEQADKSTDTPGAHLWSILTPAERENIKSIAAGKGDDSAKLKMLAALNRAIDDVARAVEMHRSGKVIEPGVTPGFIPFYEPKLFPGITLNDEEKDEAGKISAWLSEGAPVGSVKTRLPSRPMAIALNRKVLGRAFPQWIDAEVVTRQPAIYWLADVVTDAEKAAAHRCFRIDHPKLREMLHLEKREGFTYSLDEVIELDHYLGLIGRELHDDQVYQGNLGKLQHELRIAADSEDPSDPFFKQCGSLWRDINTLMKLSKLEQPYWIPPAPRTSGEWKRFHDVLMPGDGLQFSNPHATTVLSFIQAYRAHDVAKFNQTIVEYNKTIKEQLTTDITRARFETFYNHFDVFYLCTAMYVVAFLLVVISWMLWNTSWGEPVRKSAFWMIAFVCVIHGLGLIARMYLMERPWVFVTNLYSTAIFIGWIALVSALFLERYTKMGIGLAAATIVGICTGIVAVNLRIDKGDTLELQQAVLDTNFWLATHVTAINIGYSATYLAGALAIVFIFAGVFTKALDKDVRKTLTQAIYGTICFATLFSFVGTVLGGIWADQSWGRFWGWDPKENGALMIVLWNVLILHARWGGMIQARGMAILAVFGNIVTTWSYFGTNQLGVGLHAYGFMEQAVMWILIFVASQLLIMAVGLLPLKMWRSFAPPGDKPSRVPAVVATGLLLAGAGLAAAMMIR